MLPARAQAGVTWWPTSVLCAGMYVPVYFFYCFRGKNDVEKVYHLSCLPSPVERLFTVPLHIYLCMYVLSCHTIELNGRH